MQNGAHEIRCHGMSIQKSHWLIPGSVFLYRTSQYLLISLAKTFSISCDCHIMKLLPTDCLGNEKNIQTLAHPSDLNPISLYIRATV